MNMNNSLEITCLKTKIKELETCLSFAQTVVATQARNALIGDEDECMEILKAISGDE